MAPIFGNARDRRRRATTTACASRRWRCSSASPRAPHDVDVRGAGPAARRASPARRRRCASATSSGSAFASTTMRFAAARSHGKHAVVAKLGDKEIGRTFVNVLLARRRRGARTTSTTATRPTTATPTSTSSSRTHGQRRPARPRSASARAGRSGRYPRRVEYALVRARDARLERDQRVHHLVRARPERPHRRPQRGLLPAPRCAPSTPGRAWAPGGGLPSRSPTAEGPYDIVFAINDRPVAWWPMEAVIRQQHAPGSDVERWMKEMHRAVVQPPPGAPSAAAGPRARAQGPRAQRQQVSEDCRTAKTPKVGRGAGLDSFRPSRLFLVAFSLAGCTAPVAGALDDGGGQPGGGRARPRRASTPPRRPTPRPRASGASMVARDDVPRALAAMRDEELPRVAPRGRARRGGQGVARAERGGRARAARRRDRGRPGAHARGDRRRAQRARAPERARRRARCATWRRRAARASVLLEHRGLDAPAERRVGAAPRRRRRRRPAADRRRGGHDLARRPAGPAGGELGHVGPIAVARRSMRELQGALVGLVALVAVARRGDARPLLPPVARARRGSPVRPHARDPRHRPHQVRAPGRRAAAAPSCATCRSTVPDRLPLRPHRPGRERQERAAQDDHRPDAARRGTVQVGEARVTERLELAAPGDTQAHRDALPEQRPLRPPDGLRQHRLPAAPPLRAARGGGARAGRRAPRLRVARRLRATACPRA